MVTPVFSSFWLTKFFFAKEQKGSSYQLYMRKFSYYRSWRTFRGCRVAPFTNSTNWSLSQKGLDLNNNDWLCVIHMMCTDTGKVKLATATDLSRSNVFHLMCVFTVVFLKYSFKHMFLSSSRWQASREKNFFTHAGQVAMVYQEVFGGCQECQELKYLKLLVSRTENFRFSVRTIRYFRYGQTSIHLFTAEEHNSPLCKIQSTLTLVDKKIADKPHFSGLFLGTKLTFI